MSSIRQKPCYAVSLAWRAGVNYIEFMSTLLKKFQSINLMKRKRIVRLRHDVYANDIKAGAGVAHRATARTAEKVKKFHGQIKFSLPQAANHLLALAALGFSTGR